MKNFSFSGDWFPYVELEELCHADLISKQDLKSFQIYISESKNNDPDPYSEQINAINFLIKNQASIAKTLAKGINEFVLPATKSQIEYAENKNPVGIGDFGAWKIRGVDVYDLGVGDDAIVTYRFFPEIYFYEDELVWISLLRDELLSWGSDSGKGENIKKVQCHELREVSFENIQEEIHGIVTFHPKYFSLKPWQEQKNISLIEELVNQGDVDKIAELIEHDLWDVNYIFKNWPHKVILKKAIFNRNKELARILVLNGADIDLSLGRETILLGLIKELLVRHSRFENLHKRDYYLKSASLENVIEMIALTFKLGANRDFCDEKGNSIGQLIEKQELKSNKDSIRLKYQIESLRSDKYWSFYYWSIRLRKFVQSITSFF